LDFGAHRESLPRKTKDPVAYARCLAIPHSGKGTLPQNFAPESN